MPEKYEITRLPMEAVADYHVHCNYSIDAVGTVDEYCEAAIERGLAEICFTTHYDKIPNRDTVNIIRIKGEDKPTSIENFAPYVEDVLKAHDKYYQQGLSVKLGVEIGWYEGCEDEILKLKNTYDIDYFLCGLHELDNICFCSKRSHEKIFNQYTLDKLAEKYFDQLIKATNTKFFDTIAHACYYLRYGKKFYGEKTLTVHREYIDDFFKALIASDTSLEVNTSGIKHGFDHYYPQMEVINAAKKKGVAVHYLGSDAHHPTQVGYDFEFAAAIVPEAIKGCES